MTRKNIVYAEYAQVKNGKEVHQKLKWEYYITKETENGGSHNYDYDFDLNHYFFCHGSPCNGNLLSQTETGARSLWHCTIELMPFIVFYIIIITKTRIT